MLLDGLVLLEQENEGMPMGWFLRCVDVMHQNETKGISGADGTAVFSESEDRESEGNPVGVTLPTIVVVSSSSSSSSFSSSSSSSLHASSSLGADSSSSACGTGSADAPSSRSKELSSNPFERAQPVHSIHIHLPIDGFPKGGTDALSTLLLRVSRGEVGKDLAARSGPQPASIQRPRSGLAWAAQYQGAGSGLPVRLTDLPQPFNV